MDVEQKVYDLSQKLGATQGQVNTLFSIMGDIKDSVKEMASDIKCIQSDVHRIVDIEKEMKRVETLEEAIKELQIWKWTITGMVVLLGFLVPIGVELMDKLWH